MHTNPRAYALTRELKPDHGGGAGLVTAVPGVHQQARRINLNILAFDVERRAVGADAVGAPLAAGRTSACIPSSRGTYLCRSTTAQAAGIDESLKTRSGGRRDKDST